MQIASKHLFVPLWPIKVYAAQAHALDPESEQAMVQIQGHFQKAGFDRELEKRVLSTLASSKDRNRSQLFRPLFYFIFFAYLEEDRLNEIGQLLQSYQAWLEQNRSDWAYVQLCLEFYKQNWLTALHYADEYEEQREKAISKETYPYSRIYPCDAWIKGYLAAVFLRKPRKAVDYLERFAEDPAFHQEAALRILKQIQDLSYLFISLYLRKVWQRFTDEHFVLQVFKILPVDQLHEHEKEFLAERILPKIQKRPTLEGAKILMHLERYKEASEILPLIQGQNAVVAEAKFLGTQAYLEIGEFEKAKTMLEELLQIDPTHTEANILMEILNPMVGDVQNLSPDIRQDEEDLLASAIYTCIRYLESEQEELAIFLFKNILFSMIPEMEEHEFTMDQLKAYVEQMERLANEAGFSRLQGLLKQLKTTLVEKQIIDWHQV